MAIQIDELYTYLSTQVKPQLASLTTAVLQAKEKMELVEGVVGSGVTPSEVSEKLNELKEALQNGDVSVDNASRLDGKTITEIMEQIELEIKAVLNPEDLLDDESDGEAQKTYSSAKIKELLALNVEIDDTTSRDNATYSSAKIDAEIAKAALQGVDEDKIRELIAQNGSVDETKVRELIAQLAPAGVDESKVRELIAAAQLAGGGVDEEKLKELIAAEIAKNPSVAINDVVASDSSVYSSQKVNELIAAINTGGGLSEDKIKELIDKALEGKEIEKEIEKASNYQGAGAPDANPSVAGAKDGDSYFDTTANELYIKQGGAWQKVDNITNPDKSGAGAPNAQTSANIGETYKDTDTGDVWVWTIVDGTPSWKKVLDKSSGGSTQQVGANLLEGSTTPRTSTTDEGFGSVVVGTIYKNTTSGEYYIATKVAGVSITWDLLALAPSAIEVPNVDSAAVFGEIGGFGAGVAYMPTIAATLGLNAMSGASERTNENFGNFTDAKGNVFVCIPMMYYAVDTQNRNAEFGNTPNVSISYVPKQGYTPFYAFKKSDESYVPCVFVSKYIMSKSANNLPAFVKNADPVSSSSSNNGINQFSGVEAKNTGFFTACSLLGENYTLHYAALRFVYYLVAEAHKQLAAKRFGSRTKVPASICAYLDVAPYFPKGNNTNWGDVDDTSVKYQKAGSNTYQSSSYGVGKTGSASNLAKTTFNGQACGIADMGGNMWECDAGYINEGDVCYIAKGIDTLKSLNKDNYNNTAFYIGLNLENRRTSASYCGNGDKLLFSFGNSGNAYNCDNFLIPMADGMSSGGTDAYGKDYNYPLANGGAPLFAGDCGYGGKCGLLCAGNGSWSGYSGYVCARAIVVPK